MAGRTGCGLCGTESLEQVEPPLPALVRCATPLSPRGDRRGAGAVAVAPGAAAAHRRRARGRLVFADGEVRLVREDVGRHNALDKLIGALVAAGVDAARRLHRCITSRASVEMVQKAVAAGITALVAVSAPTARAVATARRAGLALVGFARREDLVLYADADRFGPS